MTVARVAGRDGAVGARYSTGYPPFTDVTLPGRSRRAVRVLAAEEADYRAVSGLVDWADGDDSWRTVSVPILDDDIAENREIFGILVSEFREGVLVNGGATNVAIDDDDLPAPPADPTSANPPRPLTVAAAVVAPCPG